MVYSQNDEQDYILGYFSGTKGRFLDIGANDGKTLSNTAALVDRGWSGSMVEPSPATYNKCKDNYKDNDKIKVYSCAVSNYAGWVDFFETTDTLLSSMNESQAKSWGIAYKKIKVQSILYKQIEDIYDFISIDAEGMDLVILKQIDLTNTKMICIEHGNSFEKEVKEYCESFGMKQIMRNFENIIMAK